MTSMMRGVATVFAVCGSFLIEAVPVIYQTCRTCATRHCGGGGGGGSVLRVKYVILNVRVFA